MPLEKVGNLVRPFGIEQRANCINQPPAGIYQSCGDVEQAGLRRDVGRQPCLAQPPARFRVAPPGSGTRARRVDQHSVGLALHFCQRRCLAAGIEQQGLDYACPRSRRAGRLTLAAEDLLRLSLAQTGFQPLAVYSPRHADRLLHGHDAEHILAASFEEHD